MKTLLARLILASIALAALPAQAQIAFRAAASATAAGITPAFRAAASAATTGATLTINKPSGTETTDVLVASIAVAPSSVAITPPSAGRWCGGWTTPARPPTRSRSTTPPSGMTESFDRPSGANSATGLSVEGSRVLMAAAGSSGTTSATAAGNADAGNAHLLALRPASVNLSIATPSGTTTGDVMIAAIGFNNSGARNHAAFSLDLGAAGEQQRHGFFGRAERAPQEYLYAPNAKN